jgi:hypothetical protein
MQVTPKVLVFRKFSEVLHPNKHESLPVISVGNDVRLLELREQIIVRTTGLTVISTNPAEAHCLSQSADARVWVFCSTVAFGDLMGLAIAVRRNSPKSRLLLLLGDQLSGAETALFHCAIDPLRSIDAMVATIKHLAVVTNDPSNLEIPETLYRVSF